MNFQNPWQMYEYEGEYNNGKSVTETAGYISAKDQIENLIIAGERLANFRSDQYDFGPDEDVPDDFEDPTRRPNFDLADASALARQINARLAAAAREKASGGKSAPLEEPEAKESKKETEQDLAK